MFKFLRNIFDWREKCFRENNRDNKCYGLLGGNKSTNYVSFACVDCPHLTPLVKIKNK